MTKHWFFDLDGTLARTGEDICHCWKAALRSLGRDLTHFDEKFTIGPPLEKVVYDLYDDATPELVTELMARFKPLYDEGGFPETVPYEGVGEMIAALRATGAKLYIVTNKRHVPTQGIVRKFGWNSLFDGVWSYDSLEEKFTKRDLLGVLAKRLAVNPAEAVMVGDTRGDVESGAANGFRTFGVTWGYGSREELSGADRIFETVKSLTDEITRARGDGFLV